MNDDDEKIIRHLIINNIRIINNTANSHVKLEISRGGLTEPQLNTMMVLVEQDGLTITELSKRLSLNHSTVSGIIDRLEARGYITRKQDESDGRYTRIYIEEQFNHHVKSQILERYTPFVEALKRATPEEKLKITEGFSILSRLLRNSMEKG